MVDSTGDVKVERSKKRTDDGEDRPRDELE